MAGKYTRSKRHRERSPQGSNGSASFSGVGGLAVAIVAGEAFPAEAEELPSDIQWAPPGRQKIRPKNAVTGKGVNLDVTIGPALVDKLNAQAEGIREKGHDPFIDFNHNENNGASGHIQSFFWAGSDLKKGGIRANVKWTSKGSEALLGREFTRFSPCFAVEKGKIAGLSSANIGGLTNRPAFGDNEKIVQAEEGIQDMDPDEIKKIIATAITDQLPTLVATEFTKAFDSFKAEAGDPPKKAEGEEEDDDEKKELKAKIASFEKAEATALEERVDKIVVAATEAGIVAPKDEKAIEAFRANAEKAPDLAEQMLKASKAAPSYAGDITPDNTPNRGAGNFTRKEDKIEAMVATYAKEHNVEPEEAYLACASENPSTFR